VLLLFFLADALLVCAMPVLVGTPPCIHQTVLLPIFMPLDVHAVVHGGRHGCPAMMHASRDKGALPLLTWFRAHLRWWHLGHASV
jgi:hypothetical protein